jgi:hypothetical protein
VKIGIGLLLAKSSRVDCVVRIDFHKRIAFARGSFTSHYGHQRAVVDATDLLTDRRGCHHERPLLQEGPSPQADVAIVVSHL